MEPGASAVRASALENESYDEEPQRKRYSRENTREEKRRMRKNRKKRKRIGASKMSEIKTLEKELDKEKQLHQESDQCVAHYRENGKVLLGTLAFGSESEKRSNCNVARERQGHGTRRCHP